MDEETRARRRQAAAQRRRRRRSALLALLAAGLAAAALALALGFRGGADPAVRPWTGSKVAAPTAPRPQTVPARRDRGVPILMYHVLADPPAGSPYPDLYVSPADFSGQMRWLAAHGFQAVTLRRVYDFWRGRGTLPRRPVVLSFDDGYESVSTVAQPVLDRHGWVGVLNLEVAHQWNDLPPRLIWRLRSAGWEIDGHTFTHPDLTTLDAAALKREVAGSREFLRRQYKVPVAFFCYPGGRFDEAVLAAVRAAGYLGATTTVYGLARPAQGLFTLSRVRVGRGDGVRGLARKLKALGA